MRYQIVRIRYPNSCWSDVIVQQARARFYETGHVVSDLVVHFVTVFNENSAAHDVVNHVSDESQVMSVMENHGSVESFPDGASSNLRDGFAKISQESL